MSTSVEVGEDMDGGPSFFGPFYALMGIENGTYAGSIGGISRSDLEALRDEIDRILAEATP